MPVRLKFTAAEKFAAQLRLADILPPQTEFRFHPIREWRIDFAWPGHKLAVEVDGGIWKGGRHNRGAGYLGDTEKLNALSATGWTVLRITSEWVDSGYALAWVESILGIRDRSVIVTQFHTLPATKQQQERKNARARLKRRLTNESAQLERKRPPIVGPRNGLNRSSRG